MLPTGCVAALTERADRVLCVSPRSLEPWSSSAWTGRRIRGAPSGGADQGTVRAGRRRLGARRARPRRRSSPWSSAAARPAGARARICSSMSLDGSGRSGRCSSPGPAADPGRSPDCSTTTPVRSDSTADSDGWASSPTCSRCFAAAQVLVMTSREDPQPLVPLEAAASGTATAGFAIGGIADLAEAGAAMAVAVSGHRRARAQTVISLLDDPDRRLRLSSTAEQRRRRTPLARGDRRADSWPRSSTCSEEQTG